jgi:hypothetical protein
MAQTDLRTSVVSGDAFVTGASMTEAYALPYHRLGKIPTVRTRGRASKVRQFA